ncbi:MAG TPA: NAD(P)H-dependent oxidoreductase [Acidimicrobiales bacterium]|nr:NAD(P)H-dependent oxidoreductase [Acidimicrobiales bacterium]
MPRCCAQPGWWPAAPRRGGVRRPGEVAPLRPRPRAPPPPGRGRSAPAGARRRRRGFSTPEYAGALPGSLKNLLDWLIGDTSGRSISGKRVAWINLSPRGAAGAHASLRGVLGPAGARLIEPACAELAVTGAMVGDDGVVGDVAVRVRIAGVLDAVAGGRCGPGPRVGAPRGAGPGERGGWGAAHAEAMGVVGLAGASPGPGRRGGVPIDPMLRPPWRPVDPRNGG